MRTLVVAWALVAAACSDVRIVDDDGHAQAGGSDGAGAQNVGGASVNAGGGVGSGASGSGGTSVLECASGALALVGDVERVPLLKEQTAHQPMGLVALPNGGALLAAEVTTPAADIERGPGLVELSPWGQWPPPISSPLPLPFRSNGFAFASDDDGPFIVTPTDEGVVLLSGLPENKSDGSAISSAVNPSVLFAVAGGGRYLVRTHTPVDGRSTLLWPGGTQASSSNDICVSNFSDTAVPIDGGFLVSAAAVVPDGLPCPETGSVDITRYDVSPAGELSAVIVQTIPETEPFFGGLVRRSDGAWHFTMQPDATGTLSGVVQRVDMAGNSVGDAMPVGLLFGVGAVGDGFAVSVMGEGGGHTISVFDASGELRSTGTIEPFSSAWTTWGMRFLTSPDQSSLLIAIDAIDTEYQERVLLARLDCAAP